MRTFSSYGPVSKTSNYYVPRVDVVDKAREYLLGKNPQEGGHYITVWASRQCGKTWALREISWELAKSDKFFVANVDLQHLRTENDSVSCANVIIESINLLAKLNLPQINNLKDFEKVFTRDFLSRPLILILDEFDALPANVIAEIVAVFRNIHIKRQKDSANAFERHYLLHGVALIGVRSVVGVENKTGSPFNVQKSLHVPNLTYNEVNEMYHWYIKESGQSIEQDVIDRIFHVTNGQPGLVSWFGELLTEEYNKDRTRTLKMKDFDFVYVDALSVLPNNNIINLISKANDPLYKNRVVELFQTNKKIPFKFEDPALNFLYMNGVITFERSKEGNFVKFPCQFVQEKLFDRFAYDIYANNGDILPDPFIDVEEIVNDERIDVKKLIELYQSYFIHNKKWILSQAPRRSDNRIFEATYHFNIFSWLQTFLQSFSGVSVSPEFPTGNGKIDLLIKHPKGLYGVELKSFTNIAEIKKSIAQASKYGSSLGLKTINLLIFFEADPPEQLRKKFTSEPIFNEETGINVEVSFVVVI